MFNYIQGTLAEIAFDYVVIDVNGVGFRVYTPVSRIDSTIDVGDDLKLHTSLIVRENLLNLYGFRTGQEKDVFDILLTVSGVGPKLGLAILSVLGVEDLIRAVSLNELNVLTRVPGVGKKTGQKILIDLKDKFKVTDFRLEPGLETTVAFSKVAEAASALENLGYNSFEVNKVISKLAQNEELTVEELIRAGLKQLARF